MSIASAALAALFGDQNMAADATWYSGGVGPGVTVRVLTRAQDVITGYGGARIMSDSMMIDVRVSDAPDLSEGDKIFLYSVWYEVQGEPYRDRERLVWSAELVPV